MCLVIWPAERRLSNTWNEMMTRKYLKVLVQFTGNTLQVQLNLKGFVVQKIHTPAWFCNFWSDCLSFRQHLFVYLSVCFVRSFVCLSVCLFVFLFWRGLSAFLSTMEYWYLWELVLVYVGVAVKRTMYQHKVDVDMLNAVKSVLADVSSVSPSSEQKQKDRQTQWNISPCEN